MQCELLRLLQPLGLRADPSALAALALAADPHVFKTNLRHASPDCVADAIESYAATSPEHALALLVPLRRASLTPDKTHDAPPFRDCLARLLLDVACTQHVAIRFLCALLVEHAAAPDHASAARSVPALVVSCLRWPDTIVDPPALVDVLLDTLALLDDFARRELIPALPDIVPPSLHALLIDYLAACMQANPTLTAVCVDALSNVTVPDDRAEPLRLAVCSALASANEDALPILMRYLLDDPHTEDRRVIDLIRTHLNLAGLSNVRLLLDELRAALRRRRRLQIAYLELLASLDYFMDLDILVFFLLASLTPSVLRDAIALLRRLLTCGKISAILLNKVLSTHLPALADAHPTILLVAEALLTVPALRRASAHASTITLVMIEVASCLFRVSFAETNPTSQQNVIAALTGMVGSGSPAQVDAALAILLQLTHEHPQRVASFVIFIKSLLDFLDNLPLLPQMRTFMRLLATIGFGDLRNPDCACNSIVDDIAILVRKYLARSLERQSRIGMLGAIALVRHYATPLVDLWPRERLPYPANCSLASAKELIDLCNDSCDDTSAVSFFYDQLSDCADALHPEIRKYVFKAHIDIIRKYTRLPKLVQCSSSTHRPESSTTGASIFLGQCSLPESTAQDAQVPTLYFLCGTCSVIPSLLLLLLAYAPSEEQGNQLLVPYLCSRVEAKESSRNVVVGYLRQCVHSLDKLVATSAAKTCIIDRLGDLAEIQVKTFNSDGSSHDTIPATTEQSYLKRNLMTLSKCKKNQPQSARNDADDNLNTKTATTNAAGSAKRSKAAGITVAPVRHFASSVYLLLPDIEQPQTYVFLASDYLQALQQGAGSLLDENPKLVHTIAARLAALQCIPPICANTRPGSWAHANMSLRHSAIEVTVRLLLYLYEHAAASAATQSGPKLAFAFASAIAETRKEQSGYVAEESMPDFTDAAIVAANACLLFLAPVAFTATAASAMAVQQIMNKISNYASGGHPSALHAQRLSANASGFMLTTSWFDLERNTEPLEYFLDQELEHCERPLKRLADYVECLRNVLGTNPARETEGAALSFAAASTDDGKARSACPHVKKESAFAVYKICFRSLARCATKLNGEFEEDSILLEWLADAASIFTNLVFATKLTTRKTFLRCALVEGTRFVANYTLYVYPALSGLFAKHTKTCLDLIKAVQPGTRYLQVLCGHSKISADRFLMQQVPRTRKVLEEFIQGAKCLLLENKCGEAWWSGNLKHRTLDGEVVASQVPFCATQSASKEEPGTDSESGSDVPDCDGPACDENGNGDCDEDDNDDEGENQKWHEEHNGEDNDGVADSSLHIYNDGDDDTTVAQTHKGKTERAHRDFSDSGTVAASSRGSSIAPRRKRRRMVL